MISSSDAATRSVAVFAPHPDDEVIACGGTIVRRVEAGAAAWILFATDGSRSHQAVLGLDDPPPERLAAIRQGEALAAAAALGVPAARVRFVGATDTRLVDHLDALRAGVDALLAVARPDEVYLPHEARELNADHRLTGRIVLERLAVAGLSPRLFKYVVWDTGVERDFGYTNRLADPPAACAHERLHREPIADQLARKAAAMAEHRTQVTLFSPGQTRAVVPPSLLERVATQPVEEFWTSSEAGHADIP